MAPFGELVRAARRRKGWTQARTAQALGVSQGYVALLERGARQPSRTLRRRLVAALALPATVVSPAEPAAALDLDTLVADLGRLGYPGFARPRRRGAPKNPAAVLLSALRAAELEPRVTEALPWLVRAFPDLDWDWLLPRVKQHDLQNRLGFMVTLARQLAQRRSPTAAATLRSVERRVEPSRLVAEDTLGRAHMTNAEKQWLRAHRPDAAAHWNVLSNLTVENLQDVA